MTLWQLDRPARFKAHFPTAFDWLCGLHVEILSRAVVDGAEASHLMS